MIVRGQIGLIPLSVGKGMLLATLAKRGKGWQVGHAVFRFSGVSQSPTLTPVGGVARSTPFPTERGISPFNHSANRL